MKLSAQKVIKVAYERCSFTRDSNYRALTIKGRFPKVRNGRPDYGWTRRFGNETGFFQEVLLKNYLLSA